MNWWLHMNTHFLQPLMIKQKPYCCYVIVNWLQVSVTRRFGVSSCGTGRRGSRRRPTRDGQTPQPGSGQPSPSLWSCSSANRTQVSKLNNSHLNRHRFQQWMRLKLEIYLDQMFTRKIKVRWRGGVRPAECRASSWWWCDWCKSKCQSPLRWTGSFQTSNHTNKQAQRIGRSLADYLCPGRIIKKKILLKCITVQQVTCFKGHILLFLLQL